MLVPSLVKQKLWRLKHSSSLSFLVLLNVIKSIASGLAITMIRPGNSRGGSRASHTRELRCAKLRHQKQSEAIQNINHLMQLRLSMLRSPEEKCAILGPLEFQLKPRIGVAIGMFDRSCKGSSYRQERIQTEWTMCSSKWLDLGPSLSSLSLGSHMYISKYIDCKLAEQVA